uniref:Uncharacterized protein n=1 Tax=Arundo donax TaxID=35708 RepID=A0A0A9HRY7_ARUDO
MKTSNTIVTCMFKHMRTYCSAGSGARVQQIYH